MKKFLQNSALFLSALTFAVLACEGMFYFLNKDSAPPEIETINSMPSGERLDFFKYHPVYGFSGTPNIRKQLYGKYVTHNARGYRGPELDYQKSDGIKRVVFIGDSQTWGWGVSDDETIPYFTGQLLNERTSKSQYEVVNLGASGFGIDQSYLRLLMEGLRYQPDYVVFTYFADNDVWEMASTQAWGVEKPYLYENGEGELCISNFPPRRSSGWPADNLASIVENRFNLKALRFNIAGKELDLAKTQTAEYFKNRSLSMSLFDEWGVDGDPVVSIKKHFDCVESKAGPELPSWSDKLHMAVKVIRQIKSTVEKNGGQFFVVAKPIEEDYRNNQQKADYQFMLSRLRHHGINVIDMHSVAIANGFAGDNLYIQYGHLSPAGNRLVAESLTGEILPGATASTVATGAAVTQSF